jgi:ribonuclease BN (tRNA processing enzyme)
MAEEGLDWAGLDAIWISHFHLDHCGGLAPYLFGMKHAPDTRQRTKVLRVFGGEGLDRLITAFDAANSYGLLKQHFPIEVTEIAELEKFAILPGVEAVALSTPHTYESHAIRVRDADGGTLAFSADTGPASELATLARNVDLFILECSFVRDKPVEKHLELAEAMHLIRRASPKRAMLTHFYPEWDAVDFDSEVRKLDPMCEIVEAVDGLRLNISDQLRSDS